MYEMTASPVNYGGVSLKNRIIFAPTTMGLPQEEFIEKVKELARGGCAMMIIGDIPAGRIGREPMLHTPEGLAYYQRLVQAAHENDCKICAQLYLSDSFAEPAHDSGVLRPLKNDEVGAYISAIPPERLRGYGADFAHAAVLAQQAGFDLVQVLGDRMLGSFCSEIFNHRTDEYGGCIENRVRFAAQCVGAIRARLPELAIDYKLTIRQENPHYGNAGVLEEELGAVVPLLEAAGVTSFHVTLANHSYLGDVIPGAKHPDFGQEGCFLKFCDMVRRHTRLPLCGVGGLTSPDFLEQQLRDGRIQCAAMSRQLIADSAWPNKVFSGAADTIRRCTRCNGRCVQGMLDHSGVRCRYER